MIFRWVSGELKSSDQRSKVVGGPQHFWRINWCLIISGPSFTFVPNIFCWIWLVSDMFFFSIFSTCLKPNVFFTNSKPSWGRPQGAKCGWTFEAKAEMLHGDSDGQGLVREVRCATWIHWADGVRMGFSFSQKPLGVPVAIVVVVVIIIIILLLLLVVVVFASLSSQFSQSPFCTRKLIVKSPFLPMPWQASSPSTWSSWDAWSTGVAGMTHWWMRCSFWMVFVSMCILILIYIYNIVC